MTLPIHSAWSYANFSHVVICSFPVITFYAVTFFWVRVSLNHVQWHHWFEARRLRLFVAKQLIVPWWRNIARSTFECSGRCSIGQQQSETCSLKRSSDEDLPGYSQGAVQITTTISRSWSERIRNARRAMNQSHPKDFLSVMKKSAVTGWRGLKSYFGRTNGLRISKSKRNGNSGGTEMEAGPSQSDLRSSNEQLPQFNLTRRTAICSVIEEKEQRHGISLAELRRELIVLYLLIDVGMLSGSRRHLTHHWTENWLKWTELKYCLQYHNVSLNSQ